MPTETGNSAATAVPTRGAPPVGSPAGPAHRTVIEPTSGWQLINIREMLRYRDLFWFLVLRDVTVRYKQTVLGFGWAIIRPLFSMVVFSVVFGGLASVPSDGVPYPIFSLAALLPWTYFSTCLTASTQSLISNAGILTKVYFPRLILPLTPAVSNLVDFAIGFVMLGAMMAWFGIAPTIGAVALPLLLLVLILNAVGVGLWLAALAVRYRDIKQASQFVVQLLMYAAPVVWPVSLITQKLPEHGELVRMIYGLYPMAGVIEGFRASLLGTTPMPWDLIGIGAASAMVLTVTGAFYFRRLERTFADVA